MGVFVSLLAAEHLEQGGDKRRLLPSSTLASLLQQPNTAETTILHCALSERDSLSRSTALKAPREDTEEREILARILHLLDIGLETFEPTAGVDWSFRFSPLAESNSVVD